MPILSLNRLNAPTTFALKDSIPFNEMIFQYNFAKQGNKHIVTHIARSAITIGARVLFILAGLVEKATRFTLAKIKQGIDKVLTSEQQEAIKAKAAAKASDAAELGKGFFQRHFGALFN
ncbi:MAG: hypothetical protein P0S96_02505 [Simkaniaceae bacterium]|nr:hypothetical protein [Candidatus Sacchlamyda saccharinae]